MPLSVYTPTPRRNLKRKIVELDTDKNLDHKRRAPLPAALDLKHIDDWRINVPRPQSAPPKFDTDCRGQNIQIFRGSASAASFAIGPAGQSSLDSRSSHTPSTISKRIATGDRNYVPVLESHGMKLDRTGRSMDEAVKQFVDEYVRKGRSSPPLEQEELDDILDQADILADNAEKPVLRLLTTKMFPTRRGGLAEGGDSQWKRESLPRQSEYPCTIATPKPDQHIGYDAVRRSKFSKEQNMVLNHPKALPYTQPALGNTCPFFLVEGKAEASGGSINHAEHQAQGGGAHCVNSMRWLLEQSSEDCQSTVCALAFSMCLTARATFLYIHYYDPSHELHWMSLIDSYFHTQPKDIQRCNWHVKNIMDYALGDRLIAIKKALDFLWPYPETWSNKKQASSKSISTPMTSFTGQTDFEK